MVQASKQYVILSAIDYGYSQINDPVIDATYRVP
jgi:hypothetical protein